MPKGYPLSGYKFNGSTAHMARDQLLEINRRAAAIDEAITQRGEEWVLLTLRSALFHEARQAGFDRLSNGTYQEAR